MKFVNALCMSVCLGKPIQKMYAKMHGWNYLALTHDAQSQFWAVKTDL